MATKKPRLRPRPVRPRSERSASSSQETRFPPASPHQKAIFAAIQDSDDSLLVNAVAGSGKTTTLLQCAHFLRERYPCTSGCEIVAISFNKLIAEELQRRMDPRLEVSCRTHHSYALQLLRRALRVSIDAYGGVHKDALRNILRSERGRQFPLGPWKEGKAVYQAANLLSAIRNNVHSGDPADPFFTIQGEKLPLGVRELACEYLHRDRFEEIDKALKGRDSIEIDYDDMVYVAYQLYATQDFKAFDAEGARPSNLVLLIDEAQDLNLFQIRLLSSLAPKRVIAFGDEAQSIYAWRGAHPIAMDEIGHEFEAEPLPLSVSWRCPRSVVSLVEDHSPIEAAPEAIEGVVREDCASSLQEEASPEDLIICRNNAPLVRLCLDDLLAGRKAKVLGRDLKRNLKSVTFGKFRSTPLLTGVEILRLRDQLLDSSPYSPSIDYLEAAAEIVKSIDPDTTGVEAVLESFEEKLQELFHENEDRAPSIRIYQTVHKAKGKEADRVWFYCPELLPSARAQTETDLIQEANLEYVAKTRAKKELVLVPEKPRSR